MKKGLLIGLSMGTALASFGTMAQARTINKTVYNTLAFSAGSYKVNVKGVVANDSGIATEFIPVFYLEQALKANGYHVTWNGKTLAITTPSSVKPTLDNVNPGKGIASITVNGKLVQNAPRVVAGDPMAHNHATSFVPVYYLDRVLAGAGFTYTYNGKQGTWELTADDTSLNTAINVAQGVAKNAVVANEPGDYAQSDLDTLNAAIRAAQAVAIDTTANQGTVATAVTTLNNAVAAFDASVVPGPVVTGVNIRSSNVDPSVAVVGDTVTLTFTTQEQVSKLSSFKIDGNNPDTFNSAGSGNSWTTTATYKIQNSDAPGPVNFQINLKDEAGVYSVTTEATTDGTSVTVDVDDTALNTAITVAQGVAKNAVVANEPGDYAQSDLDTLNAAISAAQAVASDTTANQAAVDAAVTTLNNAVSAFDATVIPGPVVGNVRIQSTNANPSVATVGDTVTLTFTTQEPVYKLSSFKIDGNNPDTFTSTGSGNSWTTTATYTIQNSDPTGLVNFQINVKDDAGLYSVTTETTTDGSSVTVQ